MKINNTSNSPKLIVRNQPSFGSIGSYVSTSGKKVAKMFESNDYNMSNLAMAILLFGATIVPRYIQAYDKHDRREILLRDTLSISALLYLAMSMGKGFSKVMSNHSGFALAFLPKDKAGAVKKYGNALSDKLTKAWDYLNPLKGLSVLSNSQIQAKYSNIKGMKNGLADFVEFIQTEGGDIKKVLNKNPEIRKLADEIGGCDIMTRTPEELKTLFKKAHDEYEVLAKNPATKGQADVSPIGKLYTVLDKEDNALVKSAKFMNNTFGFFSTFIFTPLFMVGLQMFNERLTKKLVAKEAAEKKALAAANKVDEKPKSQSMTGSVPQTQPSADTNLIKKFAGEKV